jgi:ssRNA-specific RNase YbeY (16S rRNA maturation enzyme)
LSNVRGLKLAHVFPGHHEFSVNLLICVDYYWKYLEDKMIKGDGPTAVLSGPTKKSTNEGGASMLNILISHKEEEYDLEKFWKIE